MFNRALKYALLSGAALLALGMSGASAQQTIAPASATPTNPMPDVLARYTPVTAERLKNPEDGNWLLFRRTYDGWGYSPLSQITPANVGNLELVWSFATGQVEGHQAPPIVNNGVMFVATPGNQVLAIEAKTGALLWRYKRALPDDLTNLHPTSRGVGLLGDKLYFASADAQLVAIDAKTGKELWVTKVANYHDGYYMSLMPLVADGKVMLGTSGGELGVRGFVAAYDADTGKELWRTFMVPSPGQPGSETTSAQATISTPPRSSRSTARPAPSRATSSITRTIPGTGTKSRRRSSCPTSSRDAT
jgi:alcohol dehydrogenase (cytochrome c)